MNTLLATPGLKLERLAALMGAEDCLTTLSVGRGQQPVRRFDVQHFLDDQARRSQILRLPDEYCPTSGVILEPGEGELLRGDSGSFKATETIHRTRFIMELLTQLKEPYKLIDGANRREMVRKFSYVIFVLTGRQKLLFVNDEEGNATFVVHHIEQPEDWKGFAAMTKDQLRDLAQTHPTLLSVLEFRRGAEGFIEDIRELIERTYTPLSSEGGGVMVSHTSDQKEEAVIEYEPASNGWLTAGGLIQQLGKSGKWVKARLEEMQISEEDRGEYLDSMNRRRIHYSSRVLEILREMATQHESAPDGWLTARGFAQQLGKSGKWVKARLEEMQISEEDRGEYLDSRNVRHIHYSPRVFRQIQRL